jgi:hypothetical protein
MYKTALVEPLIDDGRKLLEQLDVQRFPVSGGLWYYWPERATWKLVIISPIADAKGPHYGYTRIQKALGKTEPTSLDLDDIMLVGKKDPAFMELKIAVGTPWPESLEGRARPMRPFEDSYVYRWAL